VLHWLYSRPPVSAHSAAAAALTRTVVSLIIRASYGRVGHQSRSRRPWTHYPTGRIDTAGLFGYTYGHRVELHAAADELMDTPGALPRTQHFSPLSRASYRSAVVLTTSLRALELYVTGRLPGQNYTPRLVQQEG